MIPAAAALTVLSILYLTARGGSTSAAMPFPPLPALPPEEIAQEKEKPTMMWAFQVEAPGIEPGSERAALRRLQIYPMLYVAVRCAMNSFTQQDPHSRIRDASLFVAGVSLAVLVLARRRDHRRAEGSGAAESGLHLPARGSRLKAGQARDTTTSPRTNSSCSRASISTPRSAPRCRWGWATSPACASGALSRRRRRRRPRH